MTKGMWIAAVVAAAVSPATLGAQSAGDAGGDVVTEMVMAESATLLETRAGALATDRATFQQAAELYRKAADLRGGDDQQSVRDLRKSARLAYYVGDLDRAVEDYRLAGEWAQKGGWAVDALDSYYDAAWVAHQDGKNVTARRMLRKISVLSKDPDFADAAGLTAVARITEARSAIG